MIIDEYDAFRHLCKMLYMDAVLDEDTDYYVVKDDSGECVVCRMKDGHDEVYDDRGELFIALRNVAVQLFPNTLFRNDNYIYKMEDLSL